MSYFDEKISANPDAMRDEELLRASVEEPALFELLVERYEDAFMRAAMRVVRNRDEAEDIVQEAFLKIYRNAERFEKYEGIEFKSWGYKIVINTAITRYRKLKRGEFLVEDPALFEGESHEKVDAQIIASSDAKTRVAATLAQMPDHLKSVLTRYYFEDKSYKTIAAEERLSISTLKMRLFRAKKLFKKLSGDDIDEHRTAGEN